MTSRRIPRPGVGSPAILLLFAMAVIVGAICHVSLVSIAKLRALETARDADASWLAATFLETPDKTAVPGAETVIGSVFDHLVGVASQSLEFNEKHTTSLICGTRDGFRNVELDAQLEWNSGDYQGAVSFLHASYVPAPRREECPKVDEIAGEQADPPPSEPAHECQPKDAESGLAGFTQHMVGSHGKHMKARFDGQRATSADSVEAAYADSIREAVRKSERDWSEPAERIWKRIRFTNYYAATPEGAFTLYPAQDKKIFGEITVPERAWHRAAFGSDDFEAYSGASCKKPYRCGITAVYTDFSTNELIRTAWVTHSKIAVFLDIKLPPEMVEMGVWSALPYDSIEGVLALLAGVLASIILFGLGIRAAYTRVVREVEKVDEQQQESESVVRTVARALERVNSTVRQYGSLEDGVYAEERKSSRDALVFWKDFVNSFQARPSVVISFHPFVLDLLGDRDAGKEFWRLVFSKNHQIPAVTILFANHGELESARREHTEFFQFLREQVGRELHQNARIALADAEKIKSDEVVEALVGKIVGLVNHPNEIATDAVDGIACIASTDTPNSFDCEFVWDTSRVTQVREWIATASKVQSYRLTPP